MRWNNMEQIINMYYKDNAKKLHKMVDNILIKLHFQDIDNTDFYSLANEIFIDVIRRYDDERSFNGFLYSCLLNKFKTEMTKRNRVKRQSDRNAISLETPIKNDENSTIGDTITDKKTIENILFDDGEECFSPEMEAYLSKLSKLQREVLRLISIGFSPNEIVKELNINKRMYDDCYDAIHSYRNMSVLI